MSEAGTDLELDVVCVGGGYAGLVAANRALQRGARTLVLERSEEMLYPCNSRFAGGVMHIAYENPKAPPEVLAQAIEKLSGGYAEPQLVDAIVHNAERTIEWLRKEGALFAKGGSGWRQWILAPLRPPVTQMEWKGRGADATLRRLEANLIKRGGQIRRGAQAVRLLMQDGICRGVVAMQNGSEVAIRATNIVLADGGFQGNAELVAQHLTPSPRSILQRGAGTGYGNALEMASDAGAAHTELEAFYGHIMSRDAMHNPQVWPYPQLDELATAGVLVDTAGRRIADEGLGGVFLSNAIARQADPLGTSIIFDDAVWHTAGRFATIPPNPLLAKAGGTLHVGDSLEALASKAGLDAASLVATVREYNDAVQNNACDRLSPVRSTHRRPPRSIATAPFYAVPACAGLTYTMGGIGINGRAQVVDRAGASIPGLYAAGACTGGLEGGPAVGYGGGLMKAAILGILAAEHLALDSTRP
jgi:fumarate reductase flavoprotein subunit